MTWILSNSGTTAALTLQGTVANETILATDNNNSTLVAEIDTSNMVNGDELEIRVYTITLGGGSQTLEWKGTFGDVQINNHKITPFVPSDQSMRVTLLQRSGTITITSVTGTIPYYSTVTGLTSGATAIVTPAGGGNVSGTSTIVTMISGSFTNGETVQLTVGNTFVVNAAPTGRTFTWKYLRQ